jgi:hypothetical protein
MSRFGFAQAVAAEQEDLGVLNQAVADRGSDGRVEQNVAPQSEKGVFVVIMLDFLRLWRVEITW